MRRCVLLIALFLLALTQYMAVAEDLPEFRPALIGKAPDAIINRIDAKMLSAAGQKDAVVMFFAAIDQTGEVRWSGTYRGTPDSKLLEQETQRVLANAKMIPAVRNHQPISVYYYGTVIFKTMDGKPRLRIFANQEVNELKSENDFVGPQPCLGGDSRFDGLHYPEASAPVPVTGVVTLQLKVDALGNLEKANVVMESPPLLGFANAAVDDFTNAKFIPAFRNGQPVACEITLPLYYLPKPEPTGGARGING